MFDFSGKTIEEVADLMYPSQKDAFLECMYGKGDVLITSDGGGYGKSFLIDAVVHFKKEQAVVTSTTGVSATLIGGRTCHSTLSLPCGIPTKADMKRTNKRYKALFKRNHPVQMVIVDEISQFGPETYDALLQRMQRISRSSRYKKVRLIMSGDFAQILNVVSKADTPLIERIYGTTRLLDSEIFKTHKKSVFVLDQNKRTKDKVLTEMLSCMRLGKRTSEVVGYFNKRVGEPDPDAVVITTTNAKADAINKVKYDNNPNQPMYYPSIIKGNFPMKNTLLKEVLALKVGLRVMALANDPSDKHFYVNGSVGVVEALLDDTVIVKFDGSARGLPIEPITQDNVESFLVGEGEFQHVEKRVIGSIRGIPLKICYAITANKAQGAQFDKATLDFSKGAFAAGQVYVAFSRLTNIEGLTLTSKIYPSDIIVDSSVKTFYRELAGLPPLTAEEQALEDKMALIPKDMLPYNTRIIVTGTNGFANKEHFIEKMDFMLKNISPKDILFLTSDARNTSNVTGFCTEYAKERDIAICAFSADWRDVSRNTRTHPLRIKVDKGGREYNSLAGITRDKQMCDIATHAMIFLGKGEPIKLATYSVKFIINKLKEDSCPIPIKVLRDK